MVASRAVDAEEVQGWAWVLVHGDDSEYWSEEAELEAWERAGCPPIEEWSPPWASGPRPEAADDGDASAVPVHLQLAVTKEGAGALLGGKSVDWIEKHVLPSVRTIRPSRSVLIPTDELQRWVRDNASTAL